MTLTLAEIIAVRIHELTLRFYSRFTNQSSSNPNYQTKFDLISPYSDLKAQVFTTDYPSTKAWAVYSPSFHQLHVPGYGLKDRYSGRASYYNPKLNTIDSIPAGFSLPRIIESFTRAVRLHQDTNAFLNKSIARPRCSTDLEIAHILELSRLAFSKAVAKPYDYWDPTSFEVGSFSEFFNKILTVDRKQFPIITDIIYALDVTNGFKTYWQPHRLYYWSADNISKVPSRLSKPFSPFGPKLSWVSRISRGLSTDFYEKFLNTAKEVRRFPYRDTFLHYQRVPVLDNTSIANPNFILNKKTYVKTFNSIISSLEDSGYKYAPIIPTTTGYISSS